MQQPKRKPTVSLASVLILLARSDAFLLGPSMIHACSKLQNKPTLHSDYNDFESFDSTEVDREVQQFTKEFYEEVRLRKVKLLDSSTDDSTSSSSSVSDNTSSPLLAFLSLLNPPPPPSSSAGLFSGRGQTAYSSGRSLRAELQLLEPSQDNGARIIGWDGLYMDNYLGGNTDQLDQIVKAAAGTLIVISVAYLVMEMTGGLTLIFPWEDAMSEGLSTTLIVLSDGANHVGSVVVGDAAWLMEESRALVGVMGDALVHSMEELAVH